MASLAEPAPAGGAAPAARSTAPAGSSAPARVLAFVDRHWRWALGALLLADAVVLMYMGRGLTFFYDDWDFVQHEYGGGLHAMLLAHVGNISVFPIAVYKILFHLVGLNHYAVFRLAVVVLHLIAAGLIFTLAVPRIGRVPALLATALILFLGAAWEDLLWAFQVGYLLSIVGGLAAWVLLQRRDRLGDVLATAALVLAVGSSSLGIPLTVGVAVELAWRREWRRGWIVVVPAVLYLAWYLGYGESEVTSNSLINAPGYAVDLAAAAAGALVGRSLEWGRPLALIGLLVLLRRLASPGPISARLAGLLATGASLWIVTAATRSTISSPETSRYVYLGAVVIVLIGVELLRGVELSARMIGIGAVVVAVCAVTGLTAMHKGATGLRSTSEVVKAELGAMELASAYVPPEFHVDNDRAPTLEAGPYLHTSRAIGSSAGDTPAELTTADALSRSAADAILARLGATSLTPLGNTRPSPLAPAPAVTGLAFGSQVQRGGCVDLTPLRSRVLTTAFIAPAGGVAIIDSGSYPASLVYRRFGDQFGADAHPLAAHSATRLSLRGDASPVPWQVQLSSGSPLSICGLAP